MVQVQLFEDGRLVKSEVFVEPYDGLKWLWDQAEAADEDAGTLTGLIDGKSVTL